MLLQSALVALGATVVAAVQPLEVKGNHFYNPVTGNRFQIVGVAYQPGGSAAYNKDSGEDVLTDKDVCLRDAALLQMLGVNALRVYNLNPNLNHDECVSIFNAAGMYMVYDVNSPLVGDSLTSHNPWESYYAEYLNRTFALVEAFKDYPNTLAFFSGNEVMNNEKTAETVPPYSRAVTRDVRNYLAKHSDRPIPVGYSAADVRSILYDTYNYFQCGAEDDMSRADIFALNSYSWCGESNMKKSTFDQLVEFFEPSAVPVFFSEYGCNTPSPRPFTEVGSIYGPEMNGVFTGGIVYEYTMEGNNYGLVEIEEDGTVQLLKDFRTLQTQFAKLDHGKLQSVKATSESRPKPPSCESKLIKTKGFNNNFTLPVLPPGTKEIIDGGVKPKPSGKLVDIKDWAVTHTVKDVDGTVLKDLSVKPLDGSAVNTPGTNGDAQSAEKDNGANGLPMQLTLGASALLMALAFGL